MEWFEYLKYPAFALLIFLIYFTVKMAIEGKDKREQAVGTLLFVYLIILANSLAIYDVIKNKISGIELLVVFWLILSIILVIILLGLLIKRYKIEMILLKWKQ